MGTLRSASDCGGTIVNGVLLGEASRDYDDGGQVLADSEYRWDDSALPNGFIEDDGTITLDREEDGA